MSDRVLGFHLGQQPGEKEKQPSNSSLYLTVSVFVGTEVGVACREAVNLSNRIGLVVRFKFNDVWCWARPTQTWEDVAEDWRKASGLAKGGES